jgi:hypothetical protein
MLAVAGTATMAMRGVMAVSASRPESRMARERRPASSAGSVPSTTDSSSRRARSADPCTISRSSWGTTPNSRITPFATLLSVQMTGCSSRTNAVNGRTSSMADRSGALMAQDLGAISPTTMWARTTSDSATANATRWLSRSGRPSAWNQSSNRWASAGSATAPRPIDAIVIPS